MGCQRSIFCRNHLWLDHTMLLSSCQPSPRTSETGLTRINNFGRGKGRGEKKKEKNALVFANKQPIKVPLNFSFLPSSDGSLFQMERGTVKRKTSLILFPNWLNDHPGLEAVVRSRVLVFILKAECLFKFCTSRSRHPTTSCDSTK